ncbi:hypothetical protein ACX801_23395 [Arthrobacter bambusae]
MDPAAILALISDLYGQIALLNQANKDLQRKLTEVTSPADGEYA